MFAEFDVVVALKEIADLGIGVGTRGVVLLDLGNEFVEVEFVDEVNHTLAIGPVSSRDLRLADSQAAKAA